MRNKMLTWEIIDQENNNLEIYFEELSEFLQFYDEKKEKKLIKQIHDKTRMIYKLTKHIDIFENYFLCKIIKKLLIVKNYVNNKKKQKFKFKWYEKKLLEKSGNKDWKGSKNCKKENNKIDNNLIKEHAEELKLNINEIIEYLQKTIENSKMLITGPYGSGKTSILKTYFLNNDKTSNEDMIWISLAHYSYKYNDTKNEISQIEEENIIEEEIIASLISQINYKNIPRWSKYRIKKKKKGLKEIQLKRIAFKFDSNISNFSKLIQEQYELIYILKNSDKKIIIFEDLDRLRSYEIITKLSHINNLLKNYGYYMKFLFVLKEGIFENSIDKNKFFDSSLSIVPFINKSNSYYKFIQLIENSNEISYSILKEFSGYILDNRLVISISNDFNTYKKNSKNKNLNYDVLFILMIFKNVFPDDFNNILEKKKNIFNSDSDKNISDKNIELFIKLKNILTKYPIEELVIYISDYFVGKNDKNLLNYLNFNENKIYTDEEEIENFDFVIDFLDSYETQIENKELKIKEIKSKMTNQDEEINNELQNEISELEIKRINKSLFNHLIWKMATSDYISEKEENAFFYNAIEWLTRVKTNEWIFFDENKNMKYSIQELDLLFVRILKKDYSKYKGIMYEIVSNWKNINDEYKWILMLVFELNLIYLNKLITNSEYNKSLIRGSNMCILLVEDTKDHFFNFTDYLSKKEINKLIINKSFINRITSKIFKQNLIDILKLIENKNLFIFSEKRNDKNYTFEDYLIESNNFLFFLEKISNLNPKFDTTIEYYDFIYNEKYKKYKSKEIDHRESFYPIYKIFSFLKENKFFNLYRYYLNFFAKNFIFIISEIVLYCKNIFSFNNDEETTIEILNLGEFDNELKKIYIDYNSTVITEDKINQINDEDIRNYYLKRRQIKNSLNDDFNRW